MRFMLGFIFFAGLLPIYGEYGAAAAPRKPLMVVLHGCKQDAARIDDLTRFKALAERKGFFVLYPEQSIYRNIDFCWNWFLHTNQGRFNEAALIAAAADEAVEKYDLDPARVYIVGFSAGGAMANIVASCFQDQFAAVAIHSGLEYLAASNVWDAQDVLLEGGRLEPSDSAERAMQCSGVVGRMMPTIIFHGADDKRVDPINGRQVFEQFAVLNDLLDDGKKNQSVPHRAGSAVTNQVPGGHSWQLEDIKFGRQVLVRKITVNGMLHAWSGGPKGLPNSDPLGPDASVLIWNFVSRFSRH